MNYTIGDALIRIKNAALARRKVISLPFSKSVKQIADVLVKEGFIAGTKESQEKERKNIVVELVKGKKTAFFTDVKLISRPALRVYESYKQLEVREKRGLGRLLVSTSKGIMTGKDAIASKLGGELICEIW